MGKQLITEEYKNIVKEFEKGKFPGKPVVKLYKHPIAKRDIMRSEKQIKDTRRG
jgi:hypothetical protein